MGEFFDVLLLCVFDALRLADEIDLDLSNEAAGNPLAHIVDQKRGY